MKISYVAALLGLHLAPTFAFARSPFVGTKKTSNNNSIIKSSIPPLLNIRGGADPLGVSGADYSDAAKALFGNIVGPASMLTGGLVPLGFLAAPLPDDGKKWKQKARCLYMALSVASLLNELLAIMYATVATNKLTEVASAPAASVFALIQRDYELPWVATNVHFMLGLIGFCAMIMLRALCIFPISLNSALAGMALSALVGMISIINGGVAQGDGRGSRHGGTIVSLGARYVTLLTKNIYQRKSPLAAVSIVLFVIFGIQTIQNLMSAETQEKLRLSS